jgi:hypothetical protein
LPDTTGNRAAAGFRDTFQAADELAHDLGPLGIAEVEVVGDRKRLAAHRRDVAPGFRHRLLAALERIGLAIARRHIACQREALRPSCTRTTAASPPGRCSVLPPIT